MDREFEATMLQNQDLVLISIASWKKLYDTGSPWLTAFPLALNMYEPVNGISMINIEK
jgi:hypothetical protein